MLVPVSWLHDFSPLPSDVPLLVETCDDLGMVVEGLLDVGHQLEPIIVARVEDVQPLPGADRLRVVDIDDGTNRDLRVVCSANNVRPGELVAFARAGTTLATGARVERRTIRGMESPGMLCSSQELGLGPDGTGVLTLRRGAAEPGTSVADALGLRDEIVLDLAIEANRPDANCIAGVARDLAARLKLPFTLPVPEFRPAGATAPEPPTLEVQSPTMSPRFTARIVRGIEVGRSPEWIARRLVLAGMRPLNGPVDVSNYVMLELGQPTHLYDLAQLPGPGLIVRAGRGGERIVTLDGVDRIVGSGDCVICDVEDTPVAIGGIMGGAATEVDTSTTDCLLEAATFDPMTIARSSKRLSLRTEASARFERGVDPEGIDRAAARFLELLGHGPVAGRTVEDRRGVQAPAPIQLTTARVKAVLGTSIPPATVQSYLSRIGFTVERREPSVLAVTPPSYRPDVELDVDLIEEIARHHGYANLPRRVPRSPTPGGMSMHQLLRRRVRSLLVGCGVSEAQTPSLVGPGDHERSGIEDVAVHAANPMIREESILRLSLRPGLLRSLAFNAARRNGEVQLFEIGNVFLPRDRHALDDPLPLEQEALGVALGARDAADAVRLWDFIARGLRLANITLRATVWSGMHPGRTAEIVADGKAIGAVGEIDPRVAEGWGLSGRVAWLEIAMGPLAAAPRLPSEPRRVSRFPSSDFDLAFVVPCGRPAAQVTAALRNAAGDLLVALDLFDVYRGPPLPSATRSLGYRFRLNALDRTLTDREIEEVRSKCISAAVALGDVEVRT